MFHYVDNVLQDILSSELSGILGPEDVLFDRPDETFKPDRMVVNCFLYDVCENRELRSNEWHFERNKDGTARRTRAPSWLDCSYLVSAWAKDITDEHKLLGDIMKSLLSYRKPPENIGNRNIANETKTVPIIMLNQEQNTSSMEIWTALGVRPKPALVYTVTVCVDTQEPEHYPIVKEKVLDFRDMKEKQGQ